MGLNEITLVELAHVTLLQWMLLGEWKILNKVECDLVMVMIQ
jgi:hypothetical protein